MKWSRYNTLFVSDEHEFFLYNSRKNSFFNIDENLYHELKRVEIGIKKAEELPAELLEKLKTDNIFVEEYSDDNYIAQMEYFKRKTSFNSSNLSLVLVPTLGCNFKCPYCYENNLPDVKMKEEVQDKLIDFINSHSQRAKDMSIYWHGGEPLLAFNVIKSILNKIKERSLLPLLNQKMVSNGYLFNQEMCDFFNETQLKYLQITVDGTESTHNKSRIHKSGVPTYERIIKNIDLIVNEMPDCHVGIRVNIHNENKGDYPNIYKELSNRWSGKNCAVYPAFVLSQGECCGVSCLSGCEKSQFYVELYKKHGFKNINFKPQTQFGSCSAIYENHYVIDPNGILYKCWADLEVKERAIGDIYNGINDWAYVSEYTMNSDKFTDPKCLKCSIFPICDGGCNRFRIDNKLYGKPYDVCPVDEAGLIDYLNILYKQQKENK